MSATPTDHASASHLLSQREIQVLELTSAGLTNARIADELGVSMHAVKFHLASIYRKLGVANRTEAAVRLINEHGASRPDTGQDGRERT